MRLSRLVFLSAVLGPISACALVSESPLEQSADSGPCAIHTDHPTMSVATINGSLASFRDSGSWHFRYGTISGAATLLLDLKPDGHIAGVFFQDATSDMFNLFSNPQSAVIFADSHGEPIHELKQFVHVQSAMGDSQKTDRIRSLFGIIIPAQCDATYVLFKFQFCGFKESREPARRSGTKNVASNCPNQYNGIQLRNLYISDIKHFPEFLQSSNVSLGKQYQFGSGWTAQKLR
jgi:hypothetical protein